MTCIIIIQFLLLLLLLAGWGFVLRLKFKVLPTGKTCLLSQVVGTLTIPLGYFPMVVGVPYVSPLMVMNFTQVHSSVVECYKQWFFSNKFSHFLRKNLGIFLVF